MLTLSSRWLVLVALLVSTALWLAISSSAANAMHILAKGTFSLRGLGSVSIWLLVACLLWTSALAYLLEANGVVSGKTYGLSMFVMLLWVLVLSAFTGIADEWLAGLKAVSLLVWAVEVAVAILLVLYLHQYWPGSVKNNGLWLAVVAIALLVGAKALFLGVLLGVTVKG